MAKSIARILRLSFSQRRAGAGKGRICIHGVIAGAGLIKLYNPTVISISETALPCLRKAAEAQKADSQALAAEICIIYNSRAFSWDKKRSRKGGFIKEAAPGFFY